MKRAFGSKRVARKIGSDDKDGGSGAASPDPAEGQNQQPVVKRPQSTPKPKKRSSLRMSFGPDGSNSKDDDGESAVFTPKKSNLSRLALEKNAERKGLRTSLSSDQLPIRAGAAEDRPSYSKDHLNELKSSTPTTPKNLDADIAAKFGPLALQNESSAIPTAAEIREKKERRARLAKEQEFMSLDGDESDNEKNGIVMLQSKEKIKYAETRLVPEDEDIAEGFDSFVEDGKISLGRKAEREQERRRRVEMAELIAEAEGGDSDQESDDSEAERREAYEAAQTHAGTYGARQNGIVQSHIPKRPIKMTPVPDLKAVVERFKLSLQTLEAAKAAKLHQMETLEAEKVEIAKQKTWIEAQLKEAGERYSELSAETDLAGVPNGTAPAERGLDSIGSTPLRGTPIGSTPRAASSEGSDEDEDEDEDEDMDEEMEISRPSFSI